MQVLVGQFSSNFEIRDLLLSTADESEENIIEIDNGSFRWKGWQPPKEHSKKDDKTKRHTSEYDVIEQPFLLEDINLQIRRVMMHYKCSSYRLSQKQMLMFGRRLFPKF